MASPWARELKAACPQIIVPTAYLKPPDSYHDLSRLRRRSRGTGGGPIDASVGLGNKPAGRLHVIEVLVVCDHRLLSRSGALAGGCKVPEPRHRCASSCTRWARHHGCANVQRTIPSASRRPAVRPVPRTERRHAGPTNWTWPQVSSRSAPYPQAWTGPAVVAGLHVAADMYLPPR